MQRNLKYITVYKVTQEYGGPEEGGWWYYWYDPLQTVCIPRRWAKKPNQSEGMIFNMKTQLEKKYKDEEYGVIYRGGVEISALLEEDYQFYATKTQPHYE